MGFLNGDIDRPLVIGSQYHGVGEGDASYSPAKTTLDSEASFTPPDSSVFGQAKDRSPAAQGNLHSGHSPTWHGAAAGDAAHRHAGALLGIRSQSLDGQGYNQLLFDDSDNQLAIPWQSGLAGLAYNAKVAQEIRTVDELLTRPDLKGKVTALSEMRDTMGLLLQSNGHDPANFTTAQFDDALNKLKKAVDSKQIRKFTGNDYAPDLAKGERPQAVVPTHAWQAAESLGDWTLVGCTVSPGFEFAGFELAPKDWSPA